MRTVHLILVAALVACTQGRLAGQATPTEDHAWSAGTYLAAAFAGSRVPGIAEKPALDILDDGTAIPAPGFTDLFITDRWEWEATAITGIVLRRQVSPSLHLGLGASVAILTGNNGGRHTVPGFTLHAGSSGLEILVGYLFTRADGIALPEGVHRIRVPEGQVPNLLVPGGSKIGRLVIGLSGFTPEFFSF